MFICGLSDLPKPSEWTSRRQGEPIMEHPELKLGRTAFGSDPQAYDTARQDYPARLFEMITQRCAIGPETRAFEIGPGTGKATRAMLDLGLGAILGVEPDPRLADYLRQRLPDPRLRLEVATFEAVDLPPASFDLGYAATSFHWLDTMSALKKVARLLQPGGHWAMWWNIYQDPARPDPFRDAVTPLLQDLRAEAPSFSAEPRHALPLGLARALQVDDRMAELRAAGFVAIEHEALRWRASFDTAGIRALYGSFSVMRDVTPERAEMFLDQIVGIAETQFGGRVERACLTVLYTARLPG
jgi:SAM-dependent methyltransferase